MSEVTDLPLVILEKTRHAAEAAAASARLLESEAGTRLAAVEIRLNAIDLRMTGLETRLSQLAAGQNSHELAIMRLADTLWPVTRSGWAGSSTRWPRTPLGSMRSIRH